MVDLISVADTRTGKVQIVCPDCIGSAENIEGQGSICQPNRADYKTQGGYDRAVKDAYSCDRCGLHMGDKIEALGADA